VFPGLVDEPIRWSEKHGGFWVVSGYEECRYVMQNWELFSVAPSVNIPAGLGQKAPMLPMEVDPPFHAKYRNLLAPVFSPQNMRKMSDEIETLAGELLDGFVDKGRGDFFQLFADPLPVQVFVKLMGLPLEDIPTFNSWKKVILHGHADDPDGSRRAAVAGELNSYLLSLIAARREQPTDDLISLLVTTESEGEHLTDDETLSMLFLLFIAGLDTISSSISLQIYFLARHPEFREQMEADPTSITYAIEELMRTNSLILLARTATADTELFGSQVKKGDRILVNTISANLDARQFPNPLDVDLKREPNPHIIFGAGPHRCPGSHLARIELEIAHRLIHTRMPGYRLDPDAQISFHYGSVAGLDTLPLVWGS
jgi:cytochrome P450